MTKMVSIADETYAMLVEEQEFVLNRWGLEISLAALVKNNARERLKDLNQLNKGDLEKEEPLKKGSK